METLIIKKATKRKINQLLEFAKTLGLEVRILEKEDTESSTIDKEDEFSKMLQSAIKETKKIQEGKIQGKSLQSVLDEL